MLLMTQPGFKSTTWRRAFPALEVNEHSELPDNLSQHDIVWIISQIPKWQGLVKEAVNKHKKVIVLARHPSTDEFKESFAIGARGYLEALTHPDGLISASISVENGALWIPENLVNKIISGINPLIATSTTPNLSGLTNTEKKVAKKVALGESNREVASDLNIAERTVKSHLTAIYQKLNIRDRMHLMLYMQDHSIAS